MYDETIQRSARRSGIAPVEFEHPMQWRIGGCINQSACHLVLISRTGICNPRSVLRSVPRISACQCLSGHSLSVALATGPSCAIRMGQWKKQLFAIFCSLPHGTMDFSTLFPFQPGHFPLSKGT
jgi:hypothetical protein